MNLVREYREQEGMTQEELARELQQFFPGIDRSLVNKMERGICDPTIEVQEWLFGRVHTSSDARNAEEGVIYRDEVRKSLKSDFLRKLFDILASSSRDRPATRQMLRIATHRSDREVREAISGMRAAGIRIASSSSVKGYWLCADDEDYSALRREYISRIRTSRMILNAMDTVIPGQMRMEVSDE